MKDSCYLIFNKKGIVKIQKTKPSLKSGEHFTKINLSVPNEYFKQDFAQVNIDIPVPESKTEDVEVEYEF